MCEIRKKERETDREERADWKQESQEELRGRLTGRGVIRGGTLPRQRRGFFPLFWLEGLELGSLSEIDLLMTRSSENSIEPRVKAERKRGKHVQEKKPRNPTRFSIRVEQHTHTHTHTHTHLRVPKLERLWFGCDEGCRRGWILAESRRELSNHRRSTPCHVARISDPARLAVVPRWVDPYLLRCRELELSRWEGDVCSCSCFSAPRSLQQRGPIPAWSATLTASAVMVARAGR